MSQLRRQDLREVLDLGQIALDCVSREELQQNSLERLEKSLGAKSSLFISISRNRSRWCFEKGLSHGVPENGPKLWNQRYHKQDPFVHAFLSAPSDNSPVVVSSQVISHRQLIATEFYADFLKPQSIYHVMVLGLISHQRPIGMFGFHRPPGAAPFSKRDAEKASLLSPYLTAAVEKVAKMEEIQCYQNAIDRLTSDTSSRGVIVLSRLDKPLYANSKACELLCPSSETASEEMGVGKSIPSHLREFCRSINDKGTRRMGKMRGRNWQNHASRRDLSIEIHDCRDGTRVVYLNDGDPSFLRPDRLTEYNLTNRERAIVHLLSTGMTDSEIADKLFISIRTVQNHLRKVYSKTSVHNRTGLVNRLSR